MNYLLISTDDAATILRSLTGDDPDTARIAARLREDTGGDFGDIVRRLKGYAICPACACEGQGETCCSWRANKQGRRLARLVARAAPNDDMRESAGGGE